MLGRIDPLVEKVHGNDGDDCNVVAILSQWPNKTL